ncbi:hypothetical protein [Citrobacter pasteurii]|nr:hypothetical protein SF123566_4901 [Shigella flexneri 1235-66]CEJ65544.1 hypothetical protein [Citrobacter pasteurii]
MFSGCSYLKPDPSYSAAAFFRNKDEGQLYPENHYGKNAFIT